MFSTGVRAALLSSSATPCFDQAVKLLSRRQHFTATLSAKLRKRGYGDDEIEETLSRLESLGYLDDAETARRFVAERRRRRGWGRARLAAELRRRRVSDQHVDGALAEITDEDELALARETARGWNKGPEALGRHLDRKGFPAGVIVSVLEEVTTSEADGGS